MAVNTPQQASVIPNSAKVLGSGTVLTMPVLVSGEKLVRVVVPSRFVSTLKANPSVVLLVKTGVVPTASENMLNANVLPDVEVPSGEVKAGPNSETSNERFEPKVNSWK